MPAFGYPLPSQCADILHVWLLLDSALSLLRFQDELTSKDLFHAVYGKKILRDFKEGKLDEEGNPAEPSTEESMTRDEAWVCANAVNSQNHNL